VEGGRTTTRVERLGDEERIRELAAMLGGATVGEAIVQSARELLEGAARWKAGGG
jgi:DNA repair protein RecN (Recombination protein N)